tara:strand:+ start:5116 stop:6321 length:1206 start_codon:yes stop_codon:yes gene_type:complete
VLTLIDAIQPLYLVNIAVGIALALCVAFVATRADRDLLFWASGFALYALSFALFGLRDTIASATSIIGGNTAMALMFALFTEGICRLYGIKISRWYIWTTPVLAILGFALLTENLEGRITLGVAMTTYHSLLVLYLVTRSLLLAEGRGKWIIFAAVAGYALMFLVRSALVVLGISSGASFLSPGTGQSIYFSIATVAVVMFAIGLLVNYKERAEAMAWQQAHHDPLTTVGNRRVLQQRLIALTTQQAATASYHGLILMDLDHFKDLNDTCGHTLGDQLLVLVADRLKNTVSNTDVVIRLGGDEFVILLERLDPDPAIARDNALHIARRLLEHIRQPYQLLTTDDKTGELKHITYNVTASMGVEIFSGNAFSHEDVLRAADIAMYKAKQHGRNDIHCDNIGK